MPTRISIKEQIFSKVKITPALNGVLQKPLSKILSIDALDTLYNKAHNAPGETYTDKILSALNVNLDVSEPDLSQIPKEGPCIIVANHPFGGIEGILMASILQKIRPDFKILANYLIGLIPELRDLFIFVDPFAQKGSAKRNISPLKQAHKWVNEGGLLVLFPAGAVSHLKLTERVVSDPPWKKNMGRFIEKTKAPIVPIFFKGKNKLPFQTMGMLHPMLRTLRLPAELANKQNMTFKVSIGSQIPFSKIEKFDTTKEMLHYLRKRTYNLSNRYYKEKRTYDNVHSKLQPIAKQKPIQQLKQEFESIPITQILHSQNNQTVFYAHAYQIPNLMHEIGRQREITFREVNEGTGDALDLDHYDDYYLHLIAWDEKETCIIGAYRLGLSDQILRDFGKKGLYTSSLFKIKSSYFKQLSPAIELGRSFIVNAYQRKFGSLFLLWRGIGEFVVRNKHYRYLFGPVSISSAYKETSQKLLLDYLNQNHSNPQLAHAVKPRNFKRNSLKSSPLVKDTSDQFPELEEMIGDIEPDFSGVPILIRQYLKMGAEFLSFNVDPLFNNVIDGLIVVDLFKPDNKTLTRCMGSEGKKQFINYHQTREKLIEVNNEIEQQ